MIGLRTATLPGDVAQNVLPCCLRRTERGGMNHLWGHRQHMPQLDPEAGMPAVKLVGPETSREELLEIYLKVYKLHWLPGSPPGEPAILEEVLAAIPDWPQRREEAPQT